MADRNPTVVITSDETLPEVIDRVRGAASGGRTVDLVAPIDSSLLLTASEFRVLKEAIDEQRLSVVLRTADPLRLRLGDRLGLRVQALARPAPVARVPDIRLAAPPSIPDPVTEDVPTNGASELELPRQDPGSNWPFLDAPNGAEAESIGEIGNEEESPVPAEPSNPPRRWLPAVVLLVLLVAGAFFAIRFVVPRAVILVTPKSAPVAATLFFDVTADGQPIDGEAAFAIQQDEREVEVVWEGSTAASGVRVEPDGIASGPIELRNASAEAVTVEAGTVVATETGVEFSFVEAVEVPAADAATGEPGAATGSVSAVAAGTGGNVGTGEIGGRLPNGVYYSNRMEPTSGGTDKEFAVVAQEDLDLLSAQAQEAAATLAQDALSGEEGEGAPRVTSVSIVQQQDAFDHEAGDDAESVALRATMTVEAATFDDVEAASAFEAALAERLQEEAPEGYAVAPDDIAFEPPVEAFADERGMRLTVEAAADARAELDDAERARLADALAGRSAEEADEILGQAPDIAAYTVTYTPMWLPEEMPNNAGRIEIEVAP